MYSPPNDVQPTVQINNRGIEDHTYFPSERTIEKEAHIQSSTRADKSGSGTNLPTDTLMTNMRSRRAKAPSANSSESSPLDVYLISLRNKGRVVAKGELITSDSKRVIGGRMLGREFVGVYVDCLENVASGNKGDEELPRPLYDMTTLVEVVGFVIAWPRSHVKKATSSIQT